MAMTANFIRVRLNFDYAPPAVVGCRMCWLLVDLRSCRVVADLEGIIRDKFELSRGSILSLFIEDCYLPHTESILVVRDNDCVRVKVDSVSTTQTFPETTSDNKRKRHRPAEDEASVENSSTLEYKKKKRKKNVVESTAVNGLQIETEQMHTISTKKDKKKQKDEKLKSASAPSLKKSEKSVPKILTTTTTSTTTKKLQSSSSSSTSSSEDEGPVTKIPTLKPISKPALKSNLTSPKIIQNGRPPFKKLPPPSSSPSSSSGTDSSSEEEDKTAKAKSTNGKSKSGEVSQRSTNSVIQNGGNDSEEEIQLVIKKPVQHPHGRILVGQTWQQPGGEAGRGRGRRKPEPKELWGQGKGNCIQYNYQEKERGKKEALYSTDSLTNVSVVLQNGTGLPKPDYSSMPLLAAPPQVGQKIAFKLLELTENYTPEVSDYKEAKILSFDPNTKQIELELLTSFQAPVEPGKFDLVYQNPDGSERVEYAVDRGSLVTERWDSLLEPRLFI